MLDAEAKNKVSLSAELLTEVILSQKKYLIFKYLNFKKMITLFKGGQGQYFLNLNYFLLNLLILVSLLHTISIVFNKEKMEGKKGKWDLKFCPFFLPLIA